MQSPVPRFSVDTALWGLLAPEPSLRPRQSLEVGRFGASEINLLI